MKFRKHSSGAISGSIPKQLECEVDSLLSVQIFTGGIYAEHPGIDRLSTLLQYPFPPFSLPTKGTQNLHQIQQ